MGVSSSEPLSGEREIGTNVESEGQNWKCRFCGAENENFRHFCDDCRKPRPGAKIKEKGIVITSILSSDSPLAGSTALEGDIDRGEKGKKSKKTMKAKNPKNPKKARQTEKVQENEYEKSLSIVRGLVAGPKDNETTQPSPSLSRLNYYLVFVTTPASSLVKTRVSMNFDDYPVISIGRGPGNIVVIPDQEVSRSHASLSFDGDKLLLKDLKSSNGTFVYDGKGFQRVSDSVEVRPDSVLKFGTGTVVRLVRE